MYYKFLRCTIPRVLIRRGIFPLIHPKGGEVLLPIELPPLVTPEPAVGLLSDRFFEHFPVAACQLTFRQLCGMFCQDAKLCAVVTTPGSVDPGKDRRDIADARPTLGSADKGGRSPKELQPIGILGAGRRLIGNQRKQVLAIP